MRATPSILLTIALAATACADGDNRAATVPTAAEPAGTTTSHTPDTSTAPMPAPSTSAAPTTSATTTPTTTTTTTAAPTTTAPPAAAADIVIRLDELPTGWSPDPDDDDDESDDSSSCIDEAVAGYNDLFEAENPQTAVASFSRSAFGRFLAAGVRTDVDGAEALLAALPDAFASCDGTTDGDGNKLAILPVNFPDIGDETFAARIDTTGESFPASTLWAVTRSGSTVILTAYVAIMGELDIELLEQVARTMVDRT